MSTKFQVTFPDPLMTQLKREARRLEISVAEFVRQSAEVSLRAQRRTSGFVDPFASITGIVDSRDKDLASRVDEIYD
jgi:hypothetical protein